MQNWHPSVASILHYMNQFDDLYFSKYVKEGDELLFVCHRHPILVIDNILLWCFFGVILPLFFYLQNTFTIADIISTAYFELYLVSIYLALVYVVFDWYNDVWIITNRGVIDVDWKYFTWNIQYIDYRSIHGIEIRTNSIFDGLLGKGDIHVHLEAEHENFGLSDAVNPQGIVEYIQAVIDELHHGHDDGHEAIDDRKPFELLLDTLTDMVREHLEKKWTVSKEDEAIHKADLERVLRHTSTIDLRSDESGWSSH